MRFFYLLIPSLIASVSLSSCIDGRGWEPIEPSIRTNAEWQAIDDSILMSKNKAYIPRAVSGRIIQGLLDAMYEKEVATRGSSTHKEVDFEAIYNEEISESSRIDTENISILRVVNLKDGGYVITSSDLLVTSVMPMLAYSETGFTTLSEEEIGIDSVDADCTCLIYADTLTGDCYVQYADGKVISIADKDTVYETPVPSDTIVDDIESEVIQQQRGPKYMQSAFVYNWTKSLAYTTYSEMRRNSGNDAVIDSLNALAGGLANKFRVLDSDAYIVTLPNGHPVRDLGFGQTEPFNYCQGHTKRRAIIFGPRHRHAYVGCGAVAACKVAVQQGVNVKNFKTGDNDWPEFRWVVMNYSWTDEEAKLLGRVMKRIGDDCHAQHWYKGTSITKRNLLQHFFQKYFYGADWHCYDTNRLLNMLKDNRLPLLYGADSGSILIINWSKDMHYWVVPAYQKFYFETGSTLEMFYHDFGVGSGIWLVDNNRGEYNHQMKIMDYSKNQKK